MLDGSLWGKAVGYFLRYMCKGLEKENMEGLRMGVGLSFL